VKLLIIIPAYNEEENLPELLSELKKLYPEIPVLIVNDGSQDKTEQIARQYGAKVVTHIQNLGYGSALETGYLYALQHGYQAVAQMDADLQHDPASLKDMLEIFNQGHYDLLIGSRFKGKQGYRVPTGRKMVIRFLSALTWVFTRRWITDPTSGYQILSCRVIKKLAGNLPSDFPDADVLTGLTLAGVKIGETPVIMRERAKGFPQVRGLRALYYLYKLPLSIFIAYLRRGV